MNPRHGEAHRDRAVRKRAAGRLASVLAGALGLSLLVAPAASAGVDQDQPVHHYAQNKLPIDQQVQEQDQWCWAASGLTIAQFLGAGKNLDQNGFCAIARGLPQNSPCPNEPGQLSDVQAAFNGIGVGAGQVGGPLRFDGVTGEIDGKRPIETGIMWSAGGGHAQVIHGYDDQTQMIFYADPWPDSERYSSMKHQQYVQNSQFQWAQSLSQIGG